VIAEKRRLVLETNIMNDRGELCMTGSATIWLPE